jgi:hypothetical protein
MPKINNITSYVARTRILIALPMILQSFSFITQNGVWRNNCSKTLRAKEWMKDGQERERERDENQVA